MEKSTRISLKNQSLFNCLLRVRDPRVGGRCLHSLRDILFITLCALICGCDTWKSVELFGVHRYGWLKHYLELEHGVPSHLTFARVFALIDPQEFEHCYRAWISESFNFIKDELIAVDGKTLRGSSHPAMNRPATHLVNAYLSRKKITCGSEKVANKSNEIKAIPILLKTLKLEGCIITMDAMGTQKGIAKLIRLKKANYVLALKKNHKRFHRKVSRLFLQAETLKFQNMVYKKDRFLNYDHSRIEEREYTVLPIMYLYDYKKEWKDCQAFIQVKSTRHINGRMESSERYYITSLPFHAYKKMMEAIRSHWQIENGLYYKLDVGLSEDACGIYRGYADQNLAVMRKIVLALLQKESCVSKYGIKLKRTEAMLSTHYLRKVIGL